MEMKILIKKINELAKKSKTVGLTKEEKELQDKLRKEYLKLFRENFKNQILSVRVMDENNNDVTPDKILKERNVKNKNDK